MPNPCPICAEPFRSKSALAQHTGTNKPSTATPHACPKCAQKFCSVKAMQSHRDAPAHASMFKCKQCPRTFGDRKAVAQHEGSKVHARSSGKMKERTRGGGVGGENRVCAGASVGVSVDGVVRENSDEHGDGYIPFEYSDNDDGGDSAAHSDSNSDSRVGASSFPTYRRAVGAYYPGLDDEQDWILCDGDCGWCEHCGDGVDFD
ncbi:hypothetical protein FB567DRAFT_528538 [Paraphoma chrysanthemicola]|uniref:C2H2-type domain-containing protein n=1 Tax=Paraphoma chrysanthemicola TaxID=798071 RepID=A0A8K0VX31_9PLEO|nr:hypothetical protein FB567DRAFT_528538 [Paraphoma chrysanthemicola]